MGRVDQACPPNPDAGYVHLSLQTSDARSGRLGTTDQRDLRDTGALWLSACPCPAAPRGWIINVKKVRRIYNELGLQLRNKSPKRKVKAKLNRDRKDAVSPMEVWAMDFVHDQLATGRKFRILTVVDTWSKYVPAIDARYSYRGEDVVQTLERICAQTGYPKTIRVDQGTEFVSRDLDLWAFANALRSTSRGLASRPTMPSSRRSMADCGQNA